MKQKIYLVLAGLFLLSAQLKAQAPQALNYQGVARDASGSIIPDQSIGLKFTILQGTSTGTVVYQETQAATTNEFGLFAVYIGTGTVVSGNFSAIAWGNNTEYLEVGMDPTGGTSYTEMGTQQLLSVPYALYAASSGSSGGGTVTSVSANSPLSVTTPTTTPALSLIGSTGTILYGTGAASAFNTSGSSGQVLQLNESLVPTWVNVNSTLATSSIVVGDGSSVVVTNGNNQVVGASNVTLDVQGNAGGVFYGTGAGTSANFNPAGVTGNILISEGAGAPQWLANGSSGEVLTANSSGIPTWVTSTGGGSANAWNLTGNTGTTYGTDFIGTTDDEGLLFEMDGTISGKIEDNTYNANTALGFGSLQSSDGVRNAAFGYYALNSNTGSYNAAFGSTALLNNQTASYNTAVGAQALYYNDYYDEGGSTAANNTAVGGNAMEFNTLGSYNTSMGENALNQSHVGNNNTAMGYQALYNDDNDVSGLGNNNTAVGYNTMTNNVDGAGNTAVGTNALNNNQTSNNNTAIGYNANVSTDGLNNATAIGYNATVSASNTVQLGSGASIQFDQALMPYNGSIYDPGTAGYVLQSNGPGTAPTWVSAPAAGAPALTQNQIAYGNASNIMTSSSNWTYDGTNVALHAGNFSLDNGQAIYLNGSSDANWTISRSPGNGEFVTSSSLTLTHADGTGEGMTIQDNGGDVEFEILGGTHAITFNKAYTFPTSDGTNGQVLTTNGSGVVTWTTASGGSSGNAWNLTGNAGTTAGTNFIGTTDGNDLVFKTNSAENMRITQGGNVGIGTPTPGVTNELDVETGRSVAGYFATDSSGSDVLGVEGITNSGDGNGIGGLFVSGNTGSENIAEGATAINDYTGSFSIGSSSAASSTVGSFGLGFATNGYPTGVTGEASDEGSGLAVGVFAQGFSNSGVGYGLYAEGSPIGGYGFSSGTGFMDANIGLFPTVTWVTGFDGEVTSGSGTNNTEENTGVLGVSTNPDGTDYNEGVFGYASGNTVSGNVGVFGIGAPSTGIASYGVYGEGFSSNGVSVGTYGEAQDIGSGTTYGAYGFGSSATGVAYGLYGEGSSIGGYAFGYGNGVINSDQGATYGTQSFIAGFDGEVTSVSGTNNTDRNIGALGVATNPDAFYNMGSFNYSTGSSVNIYGSYNSAQSIFTNNYTIGVYAEANPDSGTSVVGDYGGYLTATTTNGLPTGASGFAEDNGAGIATGLSGEGVSTNGVEYGTYGEAEDEGNGTAEGALGLALSTNGFEYGTFGESLDFGTGTAYGVFGYGSSSTGVGYGLYGEGSPIGGYAFANGTGITDTNQLYIGVTFVDGLDGEVTGSAGSNTTLLNAGVFGAATNPDAEQNMGVFGSASGAPYWNMGLYGVSQTNSSTDYYTYGVYGQADPNGGASLYGDIGGYFTSTTTNGAPYGVEGVTSDGGSGTAIGVYGNAISTTGVAYGLYGIGSPVGGYAYAIGTGVEDAQAGYPFDLVSMVTGFDGEITSSEGTNTTSENVGVFGLTSNPDATDANWGVLGFSEGSNTNDDIGVGGYAQTNGTVGSTIGVYGEVNPDGGNSASSDYAGFFYGLSSGNSGPSYGFYGEGLSVGGYAYAQGTGIADANLDSSSAAGATFVLGLDGEVTGGSGSNTTLLNTGVLGVATNPDAEQNMGMYGFATGAVGWNFGVDAEAQTNNTSDFYTDGIYASVNNNGGASIVGDYAGFFQGDVNVTGTFTAGDKLFKIDDPLDPANKYLLHDCVESPDMMNIYNGNVTTDADGNATVALPQYFQAENKDFKYQLTVIGQFAQAIVATEVSNNQFTIKTDKPNVKVSWQVTGVRNDPYANDHRVVAEVEKKSIEKGHYIYPQGYGQPATLSIASLMRPSANKSLSTMTRAIHNPAAPPVNAQAMSKAAPNATKVHNPIVQQKNVMTEAMSQAKQNAAPNTSKVHNPVAPPKTQLGSLKSLPTKQDLNKTNAAVASKAMPNANKTAKAVHNPVTLSKGLSQTAAKNTANAKKVTNPIAAPKAPKIVGSSSAAQIQAAPANANTGTQTTPNTNVNTVTQQAH